jgi:hypothetical protein
MMADWIPGWTRVDLGPDGGTYDEVQHPKGCLHTTEGSTLAGAESAYRNYPPHLGYDPVRRIKHQYVRLDRYSYAFRNGETDDEFIVQVEMVGFAVQTHTWSNQMYANIAEDVLKPLEDLVGIPRQHLRFYRADEGIVLARKTSPIRLRPAALRAYSGWMGHQHAPGLADNGSVLPYGDEHWDPGGFRMDIAFSFMPTTKKVDEMLVLAREKGNEKIYVGNGITRRHVRNPGELDNLRFWMRETGHDDTVNEFTPGTLDGVLGIEVPWPTNGGPV